MCIVDFRRCLWLGIEGILEEGIGVLGDKSDGWTALDSGTIPRLIAMRTRSLSVSCITRDSWAKYTSAEQRTCAFTRTLLTS